MKTTKEKLFRALLTLTILFAGGATATAANDCGNQAKAQGEEVLDYCDNLPEFNGNLNEWLAGNIKYPEEAVKNKIEGRVIVQFVIDKNGKPHDPKVARPIHPALDAEAIRLINAMPDWKPGTHKGKKVSVKYTIPISFKLQ